MSFTIEFTSLIQAHTTTQEREESSRAAQHYSSTQSPIMTATHMTSRLADQNVLHRLNALREHPDEIICTTADRLFGMLLPLIYQK